jgi:hypothetical protein
MKQEALCQTPLVKMTLSSSLIKMLWRIMVEEKYAEAALERLVELGFKSMNGSYQVSIRGVLSVLIAYEKSKQIPSFKESDVVRPLQKIVTRCGITGVVVSSTSGLPTIYLDEPHGGISLFEYHEDGTYRDDGGEHSLDLMNFEMLVSK